jgi:hypothetical protein
MHSEDHRRKTAKHVKDTDCAIGRHSITRMRASAHALRHGRKDHQDHYVVCTRDSIGLLSPAAVLSAKLGKSHAQSVKPSLRSVPPGPAKRIRDERQAICGRGLQPYPGCELLRKL